MKFYFNLFVALSFSILIHSCAIMQPPTGGPKDESPPKIKKSSPRNGSTDFEGSAIQLEFDEFVVLNNLGQELIVSPPLEHKPEFKIKGKTLFIGFQDTLEENTTYTFNLGEGVKDYHEGNILDSNIVVFSTGEFIDSGKVIGAVYDAATLQPSINALVMLYPKFADSIPARVKPFYYSKSKKAGNFLIDYLKKGSYQLFVLEDKNNNYLYDLPNEKIGFIDTDVVIGDSGFSADNIRVHLFKEFIPNQFFIGSSIEQFGKITLGFNQPVEDLSLKVLNRNMKPDWYFPEFDAEKDTVWLWTNIETEQDQTLELEISDHGAVLDTIDLVLKPKPKEDEALTKLKSTYILNQKNGAVKYFEDIQISSSNPIAINNFKSVIIRKNDTIEIPKKTINRNKNKKGFSIPFSLKQESHYTLIIYGNSFTDIFGFKNDTLNFEFKTLSEIEYASLELTIDYNSTTKKIVQLLTHSEDEILKEILLTNGQKINFPNLSPGKYKLKMIYDNNGNGKWDTGSFIPRKQPEKVIYFSGELEIKEGWDKKIKWIIPE